MMSTEVNERLKKDTQYVSVRENTEDKVRWMGLKAVLDDTNEWNTEEGRKTGKKGPKVSLYVYYDSRKRKVKTRLMYEYRCDERLKN